MNKILTFETKINEIESNPEGIDDNLKNLIRVERKEKRRKEKEREVFEADIEMETPRIELDSGCREIWLIYILLELYLP